jgi:hypothetical protein
MPRVGYVKGGLYIPMSLTKTLIDIQGFFSNHNFIYIETQPCMSIDYLLGYQNGKFNIFFALKNLLK